MAEHDGAVEGESRSTADLSVAQDGKCQTEVKPVVRGSPVEP